MREALSISLLLVLGGVAAASEATVPVADHYVVLQVTPGVSACRDNGPDCLWPCDIGCPIVFSQCVISVCVDVKHGQRIRAGLQEAGFVVWKETNGCPGLQQNSQMCGATGQLVDRDTWIFAWHPVWLG